MPGLRSVYLAALQYAKQPEGWLVLVGGNGCGKTHLAVAVAKHCLEREIPTLFALVPDLLDQLRATFEAEAEEGYSGVLRQMKEVELLILDDLGVQAGTPWAKEKLFQLLNFRYNSGLATVITTNDVGFAGMDSRLRSRFGDRRLVQIVTIAAPDFRLHIPPDASCGCAGAFCSPPDQDRVVGFSVCLVARASYSQWTLSNALGVRPISCV